MEHFQKYPQLFQKNILYLIAIMVLILDDWRICWISIGCINSGLMIDWLTDWLIDWWLYNIGMKNCIIQVGMECSLLSKVHAVQCNELIVSECSFVGPRYVQNLQGPEYPFMKDHFILMWFEDCLWNRVH